MKINVQEQEITWKQLLLQGEQELKEKNIAEYSLDAWYLLEFVSGLSRSSFFIRQEEIPTLDCIIQYKELIRKRATRIPLQHITGEQEFMGLKFFVGPEVLIPRQDTEILVETALPLVAEKKVLDLCTGSGCIGISLFVLGKPILVEGLDLSVQALKIAEKNSEFHGCDIHFFQSNMFEQVDKKYDVLVSNPPYIKRKVVDTLMPEVKEHEPMMALDGGDNGLDFYVVLAEQGKLYLEDSGVIIVEIGWDQGIDVPKLFVEQGYEDVAVIKDLPGMDRVVIAWWKKN